MNNLETNYTGKTEEVGKPLPVDGELVVEIVELSGKKNARLSIKGDSLPGKGAWISLDKEESIGLINLLTKFVNMTE